MCVLLYLEVLNSTSGKRLVVPTAVAKGASNGFRSSWVTLTQCEYTLVEKGRGEGGSGGREEGRERGRREGERAEGREREEGGGV